MLLIHSNFSIFIKKNFQFYNLNRLYYNVINVCNFFIIFRGKKIIPIICKDIFINTSLLNTPQYWRYKHEKTFNRMEKRVYTYIHSTCKNENIIM